jgi:hypothetical protein
MQDIEKVEGEKQKIEMKCEPCGFKTDRPWNWNTHVLTEKHQCCVRGEIKQKKLHECLELECGYSTMDLANFKKHNKRKHAGVIA